MSKFLKRLLQLFICCFACIAHADDGVFERFSIYEGIRIKEIVIKTGSDTNALGLNYGDLIGPLSLQPGKNFEVKTLGEDIARLQRRNIFKTLDIVVKKEGDALRIEYHVSLKITIFSVNFNGNNTLETKELNKVARIRTGMEFSPSVLLAAKDEILKVYEKVGHHKTTVETVVEYRFFVPQVVVFFKIKEGYRSRVGRISINGEIPEDVHQLEARLNDEARNVFASKENIKNLLRRFLVALRLEGYIQASVNLVTSQYNSETGDVDLEIEINSRRPISLIFTGSKRFSVEELIALMKLETRTVPFGPGALSGLCLRIEELYEQNGYPFARAIPQELEHVDSRYRYEIVIEENSKVHLGEVRFEGNTFFGSRKLSKTIRSLPSSRWFGGTERYAVQAQIEADVEALVEQYENAGFKSAKVNYRLDYDPVVQEFSLVFIIDEGQPNTYQQISLVYQNVLRESSESGRGKEIEFVLDNELLMLESNIKPQTIVTPQLLQQEQTRLLSVLKDKGYPEAVVSVGEDTDNQELLFVINLGHQLRIANIIFRGNVFTRDYVIRRTLEFKEGDFLNWDELQQSEQNLYATGLFQSVSVRPGNDNLGEYQDIFVETQERDTGSITTGLSFNTEDGVRLTAELGQRNFEGRGDTILFGVDGFFKGNSVVDAGRARILYAHPYFLETKAELVSELFAQFDFSLIDQYSFNRFGASSDLRREFLSKGSGKAGITVFVEDLFDVEEDVILGDADSGQSFYSILQGEVLWDARNDAFNPSKGGRTAFSTKLSSDILGSEENFLGASLEHSQYLSLSKSLVWANRIQGQYLRPFADTDVVPLSQRLFLGGRGSLRGFSPYAVGPRGEELNIVGGDSSLVANTELQFSLTGDLILVSFFDAGQAFLIEEGSFAGDGLDPSDLRYSPGVGFHYRTPIGPLAVEYGVALDREFGERFGRLHFGIGGAF